MLDILKNAFGRLVNSQKLPSSDETAEEGSYWENELALFAPMEFLPGRHHGRTNSEPAVSAAASRPAPSDAQAQPGRTKLAEPA